MAGPRLKGELWDVWRWGVGGGAPKRTELGPKAEGVHLTGSAPSPRQVPCQLEPTPTSEP